MNNQYYQFQSQYFPQPTGSVYTISSSLEVGNIPMGVGVTAIISPAEKKLYLKSLQNGNPTLLVYNLSEESPTSVQEDKYEAQFKKIFEELEELRKFKEALQ